MSGGGVVQVHVPIPNSIYFYNQLMAGVDLSDQLKLDVMCISTGRYFSHCMDISVTNAYLLYKENLPVAQQSRYDHKRFVPKLVKS